MHNQIAFGLNINTVGGQDTRLFDALNYTLKSFTEYLYDPYMAWRWSKREQVRKTIQDIRYLRNVGREIINERLERMKNEELSSGKDILSSILNSWGKFCFILVETLLFYIIELNIKIFR